MSQISCRSIKSRSAGSIIISPGTSVINPGSVAQLLVVRTNAFTSYSSPTTGNGTTITDLNLVITPKKANSMLVMQWMLNCEVGHDTVFLIHKNGSLITDVGYEGRNNIGNNQWVGYVPANYENNTDSTPACYFIQYAIPAGSTDQQTFAPATRSSSASASTLFLNRSVSSAGASTFENMVSTGKIMEIGSE